jgi:hypothetical protein
MKIICTVLAILAGTFPAQTIAGGYTDQTKCPRSGSVSPFDSLSQVQELVGAFCGGNRNVVLIKYETQVVAGVNFNAVFRLSENGQSQYLGISGFVGLGQSATVRKFFYSNTLQDILNGLQFVNKKAAKLSCRDGNSHENASDYNDNDSWGNLGKEGHSQWPNQDHSDWSAHGQDQDTQYDQSDDNESWDPNQGQDDETDHSSNTHQSWNHQHTSSSTQNSDSTFSNLSTNIVNALSQAGIFVGGTSSHAWSTGNPYQQHPSRWENQPSQVTNNYVIGESNDNDY